MMIRGSSHQLPPSRRLTLMNRIDGSMFVVARNVADSPRVDVK